MRIAPLAKTTLRIHAHLTKKQVKVNPVLVRTQQEFAHLMQLGKVTLKSSKKLLGVLCQHSQIHWILTASLLRANKSYYLLTPHRVRCRPMNVNNLGTMQIASELLDTDLQMKHLAHRLTHVKSKSNVKKPRPPVVRRRVVPRRVATIIARPSQRAPKKTNQPKRTSRWWIWTLVGVGAAGTGATVAYFLLRPPKMQVNVRWTRP